MKNTAILLCFAVLFLTSCSTVGRIKTKLSHVMGVKDAGKGASLDETREIATLPLPAGSTLKVTKWDAVPWKAATETSPEVRYQPAREETEVVLKQPTEWTKTGSRIVADTGTVDVSIRKHQIDVQASQPLLLASIACVAMAIFLAFRAYPTPAIACGVAAVIFFMQWQMTSLPDWFKLLGVASVVGGVVLWIGHRRGERDGVKEHLEELAKAKALAVPVAPPVPVVVTNPTAPNTP